MKGKAAKYTLEMIIDCEYFKWTNYRVLIVHHIGPSHLRTETQSDHDYLLAIF